MRSGRRARRRRASRRVGAAAGALLLLGSCGGARESPSGGGAADQAAASYRQHCAGCHGADGWNGPATPLANPVYLAWASDEALESAIAGGRPGTGMPAFANGAGGPLTGEEIALLVRGIRSRWGAPLDAAERLPPYAATPSTGLTRANDIANGAAVYVARCMGCHEPQGVFRPQAGSLRDPTYLALVSDQSLRTAVVTGRPDLGMPDWRGDREHPGLEHRHVWEVVAYLASFRKPAP